MKNLVNVGFNHRGIRNRARSLFAVGAASSLLLAGLAFVAVTPASAAATTLTVSTIATQTAGTAFTFTVTPADGSTTDVIGITSSCSLGGTTSETSTGGVATFNAMYIETGTSCTLNASVTSGGDTGSGSSNAFTVQAGSATKVVFTPVPASAATVGVAMATFKASIEDQYGNVETSNSSDVITVAPSAGCVVTGGTATVASGVATFSALTFTSGSSCTLTASDTTNVLTASTPVTVAVATDTPSKVGFTVQPPTSVVAGSVMGSFAVSIEESNGIPFTTGTGSTDSITLTSTCTLGGTTTVTAVAGVATFAAVTIKKGTACTLVATDGTRALTTGTSNNVTVLAGAATQVVFTTPPPTVVTTASTILTSFKASVEDVNGNVVTTGLGSADTITITSPCTLGGTTTGVESAGYATFSALSINVTGACVLTATDTTRTLLAATATSTVGTPQAALVIKTIKGTVGKALKLATTGGTGTGALTYSVAAGSSAGCTISGNALKARRAGSCVVTATKAGTTTYITVSSVATKVTFVLPFKVTRVAGTIFAGRTQTVTLIGSGFTGRPRIISNVGGLSARVTGDTGKTLKVVVAVSSAAKKGVHTMTVILSNGKRTSVKFSLR